jgi:hypothetical protein
MLAICSELMLSVYKVVVTTIVEKVKKVEMQAPIAFNVSEMPVEGLAKVRYVGAWVIRKVLNKNLKYVKDNFSSCVSSTLAQVQQKHLMCELLEEFVIAKFAYLQANSYYPQTLSATEDRQYRSRGLFHIDDKPYEFFVALESQRVKHINEHMLHIHRDGLIDYGLKSLRDDKDLFLKWKNCFVDVNDDTEQVKKLIFLLLYINPRLIN